jgi:hypothetical protein
LRSKKRYQLSPKEVGDTTTANLPPLKDKLEVGCPVCKNFRFFLCRGSSLVPLFLLLLHPCFAAKEIGREEVSAAVFFIDKLFKPNDIWISVYQKKKSCSCR